MSKNPLQKSNRQENIPNNLEPSRAWIKNIGVGTQRDLQIRSINHDNLIEVTTTTNESSDRIMKPSNGFDVKAMRSSIVASKLIPLMDPRNIVDPSALSAQSKVVEMTMNPSNGFGVKAMRSSIVTPRPIPLMDPRNIVDHSMLSAQFRMSNMTMKQPNIVESELVRLYDRCLDIGTPGNKTPKRINIPINNLSPLEQRTFPSVGKKKSVFACNNDVIQQEKPSNNNCVTNDVCVNDVDSIISLSSDDSDHSPNTTIIPLESTLSSTTFVHIEQVTNNLRNSFIFEGKIDLLL